MVEQVSDEADRYIHKLKESWKSIEDNYKIGNSFY